MDRKRLGTILIVCTVIATVFIRDFADMAFLIVSAIVMGNLFLDSKESDRRARQEEHIKSLEYRDRLIKEAREQGKAEALIEIEAKNSSKKNEV